MFAKAYSIASQYTAPVVLSRRNLAGECSSTIGAFIVVNGSGWVLTAFHIVDQFAAMLQEKRYVEQTRHVAAALLSSNDPTAQAHAQQLQSALVPQLTQTCSAWWGRDEPRLIECHALPDVDLALCRLEPFDPGWLTAYPVFKDPDRDFEPGVSLCKLGFPFHHVIPQWDEPPGRFVLPPEAIPIPRFPIEGILTRMIDVAPSGQCDVPLRLVETSSPGLKGQSGGPTFDAHGTVWAIQVRTQSLPLGFEPKVNGVIEHQFLNVGLGAHACSIVGLMRKNNVSFTLSAY
jgi:hypothetical protein